MDESILNNLKKYCGIDPAYDIFDRDVLMNANAVFFELHQLGAGPPNPFVLSNPSQTWSEFSSDPAVVSASEQYLYLKVRSVFDPPSTSFVIQSMEKTIAELEWRIRDYCAGLVPDNPEPETDETEHPDDTENPDGCNHVVATDPEAESVLDLVFS